MEQQEAPERGQVRLDFTPGLIKGAVQRADDETESALVEVPVDVLTPEAKQALVERLGLRPLTLYRLLAGRPAAEADAGLPSPSLEGDGSAARCSCGRAACSHAAAVLDAARQRLAAEPLERLALLGLPREALLAGVYDAWGQTAGNAAGGSADEAAARAKEKGAPLPSPGEWLAEAAAEGRLHRPGPQLDEVEVRLSPPPPPEELRPAGDWAGLLPGVRGASKALGLVVRQTAARAEQLRRQLPRNGD